MGLLEEIKQQYLNGNSAVKKLIAINVIVFLAFAIVDVLNFLFNGSFPLASLRSFFYLPASFSGFIHQPWSLITHLFIHVSFLHLLFNMMLFYWMGNILEEYLGKKRVYLSYFLGGILGGLLYMFAYNVFPAFASSIASAKATGASAGVLAVVFAAATLLPDYEVRLVLFGFVRLKWIALAALAIDVIGISGGNPGGHIAHLGGALTGFLYVRYLSKYSIVDKVMVWFKPKSKLKVYYHNTGKNDDSVKKHSEQEVDRILDKINKSGYDSLTQKEKDILYRASNQ